MVLFSETLEGLKGRLEAWKGALKSKGLRVNVMKTKMMIGSENAEKVTIEGKFPCSVYRKVVGSNPILCQFSSIRGKLKEDSKFIG